MPSGSRRRGRWKVYQEYDNFGDNILSVFPPSAPAPRIRSSIARGRSWVSEHKAGADRKRSDGEQLVEAFRRDVETGKLPQVSWIVTAADLSEHPTAEPSKGEHVTAELIEALVDNPEVFAKTVFILNYDEAGGFYDHAPPPVPPDGDYRGHSTVPLDGETKDYGDGTPRRRASIRSASASARRRSSSRPGAAAASSARSCSTTPRCSSSSRSASACASPISARGAIGVRRPDLGVRLRHAQPGLDRPGPAADRRLHAARGPLQGRAEPADPRNPGSLPRRSGPSAARAPCPTPCRPTPA
jgi:hypothetical protein